MIFLLFLNNYIGYFKKKINEINISKYKRVFSIIFFYVVKSYNLKIRELYLS